MRTFNKWQPTKMSIVRKDKIKIYKTFLCPKCQNESIIATNYCSRCGKRLRKERDDIV